MKEFIMYHLYKFANKHSFKSTLNIGAYDCHQGKFPDLRTFFKTDKYLAIDLVNGPYVDRKGDITKVETLPKEKFDCIICCETFEHVDDIFQASKNIMGLMEDNGMLFISVPFHHIYHDYPKDYWRMTEFALDYLFKGLKRIEHYKEGNPRNPDTNICIYKKEVKK